MDKIIYPDGQTLKTWTDIINNPELFPPDLLPEFNEIWFREITSFIELLKLSHYKENLHHKAAHLFYKIAKGHRFVDGNKRSAIIALDLFFMVNSHTLIQTPQELYELALSVVKSQSNESEKEIEKLELKLIEITEPI